MNYPKQVMTVKELREMGFPKEFLLEIYRSRNQKIAWKTGTGGRTSTILFDTEKLEKFRKAQCTGV